MMIPDSSKNSKAIDLGRCLCGLVPSPDPLASRSSFSNCCIRVFMDRLSLLGLKQRKCKHEHLLIFLPNNSVFHNQVSPTFSPLADIFRNKIMHMNIKTHTNTYNAYIFVMKTLWHVIQTVLQMTTSSPSTVRKYQDCNCAALRSGWAHSTKCMSRIIQRWLRATCMALIIQWWLLFTLCPYSVIIDDLRKQTDTQRWSQG